MLPRADRDGVRLNHSTELQMIHDGIAICDPLLVDEIEYRLPKQVVQGHFDDALNDTVDLSHEETRLAHRILSVLKQASENDPLRYRMASIMIGQIEEHTDIK
jgi:hypothetical protein